MATNGTRCGNPQHPDGAWHRAGSYPVMLRERLVQWWRRKRWGCGCPTRRAET